MGKLVAIVGILVLAIVSVKLLVWLLPIIAAPVVFGSKAVAFGSFVVTWAMLFGLAFFVFWWRTLAAFK